MISRPVQVAVYALWWATSGCSDEAPQNSAPKTQAPRYTLERPTDALPQPTPLADSFRRGVSLTTFVADEGTTKPLYGKFLDDIVDMGVTDLELIVRWSQVDQRAIEIAPVDSIDDAVLGWMMDEANTRGLRVSLLPLLEVESQPTAAGRSSLAPEGWDRWWWSYHRFIISYARIAAAHKADVFSVGAELAPTESQAERWRSLVTDVRKVYRGKLLYVADIDRIEQVSFLDKLDLVGVSGLPRVLQTAKGSDEQIRQALIPYARKLSRWALAQGRRYLFTDLGQTPVSNPAQGSAQSLEELRRYRALFEVWKDDPRLEGVFAGTWIGKATPAEFASLRNKPSAAVLRHWYRASRVAAQGSVLQGSP